MKRIIFILALTVTTCAAAYAQKVKHVILVSIDGLRPDFYKDKSWPAPNLQRLMAEGVYADEVHSVFPSVTYPSHTTIVTGAYPARHGIYYNVPFGAKNGHWYWEESYIKTGTLWDAIKKAGMTSAAVMWPVTVGAPINYNFPVRRADDDEKTDQLTVTRPYVTPSTLIDDYGKAYGTLSKEDFGSAHDRFDKTVGNLASYIIRTYKPNLTAIHFLGADHEQHAHGRDAAEVKNAVAVIDSMIGTVIKTVNDAGLKSSTAIIITGDHGHVDTKASFAPNVYLAQHQILTDGKNWRAKFHPAGGSAFLYLKDKNDTKTLEEVKKILADLPEDKKALFRVLDRTALDKIGANPEAALGIAMKKGITVSNAFAGEPLRKVKKQGSAHGYYPDFHEINTGFIAIGAGINQKKEIPEMGIKDVAPLVSQLLGLNFKAPDGILISGILSGR
ncbi:alkaline phosphatase family protein [Pedobacter sp. BS3]|uniref:alkaline phosphatase family protein n=1 Tax=Pedobacter sp. BS3 TaxID=2567937 RepID=UPI0011EE2651|nr:ectonucleotide pyrophosphatase/phosphodiesterase [Pedobacter sp. BS3]TZF81153.1 alkaline phosphatase family protein [Pedobacter sp. BS3]